MEDMPMPQLASRMDNINWLTPAIPDILEQGAAPPGGDGTLRDQTRTLQQRMIDLDTPIRVINVRTTPSHTMLIARPDTVGRPGSRRSVTVNEVKRSLGQVADDLKDWKIGFLPQLQEAPDAFGILLRTNEHQPVSLRRMLVRPAYRDHPSTLAFILGNTLEQRLIVQDLAAIGNFMVIGTDAPKQTFIRSLLITLTALNTPGELRLILAGSASDSYRTLAGAPHALGRLLTKPQDGQRLLDGLTKELERRQGLLKEENVEDVGAYNAALKDQGKVSLPRILLVVDSLSDDDWQEARDSWIPSLTYLLSDHGRGGIHVVLTASQMQAPDVPGAIAPLLPLYVVLRSAAASYTERLKNFHNSLLRFIDALVIDSSSDDITPVELPNASETEAQNAVNYWRQASAIRMQDQPAEQPISGRTGVTGMLDPSSTEPASRAPVPSPALDRSTDLLARTAQITGGGATTAEVTLQQAQALAAYLGWIGIGPLQDILGMSVDEAKKTLIALRTMGIVENSNSPTPRFVRYIGQSPE
jgi:DNA segregation ATPase FtsK/SpoIIIE-like protein